jgi:hypothetical protein
VSKWFEVKVTSIKVLAVEVADSEGEKEATDAAISEVWGEWDEIECSPEITDAASLDAIRRHADEVLALEN